MGNRADVIAVLLGLAFLWGTTARLAFAQEESPVPAASDELQLEDLGSITVTSVALEKRSVFSSPAAVYVLTPDDLRASGATNLPDALRGIPGVEVTRVNSRLASVTIRGSNGLSANKLLPMIDGRSLYSARFSGTVWDLRDVLLEDVEQIEVVRGPGGAVWGTNAVNGVVNIVTKDARATQGSLVSAQVGTLDQAGVSVRHGFRVGADTWARVYGKAFLRSDSEGLLPADPNDAWYQARAGFRIDHQPQDGASWMISGDLFQSEADQIVLGTYDRARSHGGYVLGRAELPLSGGSILALNAFFDSFRRDSGGTPSEADVGELSARWAGTPLEDHRLQAGGFVRVSSMKDWGLDTPVVRSYYDPLRRQFGQYGAFVQDEITTVAGGPVLTLGAKYEYDEFSGWNLLPSVRASWTPASSINVWAALSEAARIPSRGENDQFVSTRTPTFTSLGFPGRDLDAEQLRAAEVGVRWKQGAAVSVDLTAFYNDYDGLITVETRVALPTLAETEYRNLGWARNVGAEAAVSWRVNRDWLLRGTHSVQELVAGRKPGGTDPAMSTFPGYSPRHQTSLQSRWYIGDSLEVDVSYRHVGRLRTRPIASYDSLDVVVSWAVRDDVEVSLVGQNLLDSRHPEIFSFATRWEIPRSAYLRVTLRR